MVALRLDRHKRLTWLQMLTGLEAEKDMNYSKITRMRTSIEFLHLRAASLLRAFYCIQYCALIGAALANGLICVSVTFAEDRPIRIGFIGSLSGFASSFGTEALRGVELAVSEANKQGRKVTLSVEDDSSNVKSAPNAYQKLKAQGPLDALIGGSWWVRSIVPTVSRDKIAFLSVETLFDSETVPAPGYFIMQGDLREWIRAYEPLIASKGWKRALVVRFISGFGQTLADGVREQFSRKGRAFLGDLSYEDIAITEAAALALRVKILRPDVIYVDGQPGGIATLLTKLTELHLDDIPVMSHIALKDACDQRLFNCAQRSDLYFSARRTLAGLNDKFLQATGKPAYLNADLGYYATRAALQAIALGNPISALTKGAVDVDGSTLRFDHRFVLQELLFDVSKIEKGASQKLEFPKQ